MHCMLVVRLLRKHGFGFLISSSSSSSTSTNNAVFESHGFRKILYSSVLATDMSLHFAWIARLKEFGASLRTERTSSEEDDRIMLCQAIIKCADISNPVRPSHPGQWRDVANDRPARLTFLNTGVRSYLKNGQDRLLWNRIWICLYR